ncbi:MAG: type II toxin-antitoxin system MqsA family antitoxin [Oscillospiraceae bacterium]|nr:type II toxin-antitoxin system MqsA family antitoxin [Oscillospiraceae bacterium]
MYCPNCGCDTQSVVQFVSETYPVKGENITIEAEVRFCTCCKTDIWDEDLDNINLKKAFSEYRKNHDLLSPEEIRSIREKYSVSQTTFARILGFGDKTITRYENGSLADATHNNLIYLVRNPDAYADLLEKRKNILTEVEYAVAINAVNKLLKESVCANSISYSISTRNTIRYSMNQSKWEVQDYA